MGLIAPESAFRGIRSRQTARPLSFSGIVAWAQLDHFGMNKNTEVVAETPRLVLRRLRITDVDSFVGYRADPEVARYQSWESCTQDEAAAFIASQLPLPLFQAGYWSQIAIELRETGAHIGDCGLRIRARDAREGELGFTFARAHQGQGLASEAVSHLLEYAFTKLDLHRVFAIADDRNVRAVALLERVGMRREGHFREAEWLKGEWVSDVLYAILERERRAPPPSVR